MAADELALLQRPGGEREGLGRRCPWLEPLRTPVCRQECPGGGAVACQGGLARCCEAGSAWRGAAVWAKARGPACRLGRGIVQYARSGRVQCTHGRCSTQCRGMLQVAGEVGVYQIEVRSNWESSGHASLIRGASSQCNAKTHVKTGHAYRVLDRMPHAPRHLLG